MSDKLQAPKGTFDVLPASSMLRDSLIERIAAPAFARAGYSRIDTPMFEDTGLFARGVGESTDVVSKEMYTFLDQGDRSLTLRPEGTAPVCRAYVEHGMHKLAQPVKLWYQGPFFRQEAPQAGRFRQFFQIGAEALGSDDPALDAESIVLLARLLEAAGATDTTLRISSLGSRSERIAYSEALTDHLRENERSLSADVLARIDQNPLRAFDAKHEGTRSVMEAAPRLLDAISAEDREHFDEVLALLDAAQVPYEVDSTLVRGLDYYTRTVFEFTSPKLGAQAGVGGGGRYDGLVELLGGPPTAGIGWACGVERVLAAAEASSAPDLAVNTDVYVALDDDADRSAAFTLLLKLREVHGLSAQIELAGRSLKGQLKQASRIGANVLVIFGGERGQYDAAVKNLQTGEQQELDGLIAGEYLDRIAERVLAEVKR
ncbi:MAG: histidine--tRNA ligase [Solirubrobacterales bacterium]